MQKFSGLELSPRKASYLKFLRLAGGQAKISELAAHFDLDPSTVTRMIGELKVDGYVIHEPYGGVQLTSYGYEYGEFLLRRHRIIGLVLSHYGLSQEEACEEASRIEYYLSRSSINKMCRSLGHPTTGLCGEICHDPLCH